MPITKPNPLLTRIKQELPPAAPLPAVLQTLACRWLPLPYFEWCRGRYGNRFTVYPVDKAPVVFISDPKDIREILSASAAVLHPGVGAAAITPIVGEHSFMLRDEEEHLLGRKAVLPAFHKKAVQDHADTVADVVEREIALWPLDVPFSIHPHLRDLTLKVILMTVFGNEGAGLDALHTRIVDMLAITKSFAVTEPRLRRIPGWRNIWRRFERARDKMDELMLGAIRRRRCEPRQHTDVLDMLLATNHPGGSPMSDREVRDNIMSIILAGHETTASALAWAFQLLAHNPTVRDRLVDELNRDTDEAYLTATIQEVLRHRPVFLFAIPRAVVEPIEVGGWTYRPPTHLLACIYLMHHDPAHYSDPRTFRPERFLEAAPSTRTWIPWGGGRRRCPGHRLAFLEMQTVLRTTLATRTILPASARIERARWRSVIVTPHAGSRIILRKSTRSAARTGVS